jgi:hypothetical protein
MKNQIHSVAWMCGWTALVSTGVVVSTDGGQDVAWRQLRHPGPVNQHAVAFDDSRGRLVYFGGQTQNGYLETTFEWNGASWSEIDAPGPIGRDGHVMTYDAQRGRVILFGGVQSSFGGLAHLNDTWAWDGAAWTFLTDDGPHPRERPAFAYDAGRDRVVMHGGTTVVGDFKVIDFGDTWEFDGTSWAQVADGSKGPGVRINATMAYDESRGRIVLFGGTNQSDYFGDTWEWDGVEWTLITEVGPPCRAYHSMTYDPDRGKVVLFGGAAPCVNWPFVADQRDTWEWDGVEWVEVSQSGPFKRRFTSMAYDSDRQRTLLFGGWPASYLPDEPGSIMQDAPLGDLWEWDGSAWHERVTTMPLGRYAHEMAYDSNRDVTVMFGGRVSIFGFESETWEFDGSGWVRKTNGGTLSPTNPEKRGHHAMAYDSARQVTWMFGGARVNSGAPLDETWEWDGDGWQIQDPPAKPPALYSHAMAYDAARERVVMFGGLNFGGAIQDDTWEFDGSTWTQVANSGPAPRYEHSLVYDAQREKIVLFGGWASGPITLGDTWEWDGVTWTQVASSGPLSRASAAYAYDEHLGMTVVRGGISNEDGILQILDDTWGWDGTSWTQLADTGVGERSNEVMVYESARRRLFLFGGSDDVGSAGAILNDMWTLSSGSPGDADFDGDVDLVDFEAYDECRAGPNTGVAPTCLPFDFDLDGDIDWRDFGIFQIASDSR